MYRDFCGMQYDIIFDGLFTRIKLCSMEQILLGIVWWEDWRIMALWIVDQYSFGRYCSWIYKF